MNIYLFCKWSCKEISIECLLQWTKNVKKIKIIKKKEKNETITEMFCQWWGGKDGQKKKITGKDILLLKISPKILYSL